MPTRAEKLLKSSTLDLVSYYRISSRPLFEICYTSSNNDQDDFSKSAYDDSVGVLVDRAANG